MNSRLNIVKNLLLIFLLLISVNLSSQVISSPTLVSQIAPVKLNYSVSGELIKKVSFNVEIDYHYASLSLLADGSVLIDNIDIPTTGTHQLDALIEFDKTGSVELELRAQSGDITINTMDIQDFTTVHIPYFKDISEEAGLDRVSTYKYYGPCVADFNQDGYYDFVVVNHNIETNKLYWNNGDGTVTKHHQDLSRWYMEDLHGASAADYDNDGDLDLISTKGGGNGTAPSFPDFWRNDNDTLVIVPEGELGLTKGARGRGARWIDMDLDGDLDFVLVNAPPLDKTDKPFQFFYKNKGDGSFEFTNISGIEDAEQDRALVTDLNGDNIDDIVLYGWGLSVWQGNGDFTFTDITSQLPGSSIDYNYALSCTDIDIDNDGDFDLYFAKGNSFGTGFTGPTVDYDPVKDRMDIKVGWIPGSFESSFTADGDIRFFEYYYDERGDFLGGTDNFPIMLGSAKDTAETDKEEELIITRAMADGWPADISGNGIYFGHIGNGDWKTALVINGDILWNLSFSLENLTSYKTEFTPENRNIKDVLLRNDGGTFTDVSDSWNIPSGGGHNGVMVGDFNNDSYNDLFLHRWGHLKYHTADLLLLNTGAGSFETVTMHGAQDIYDEGHGDMGQAFDFDMDGNIDLLNGSDEHGMWYLYENNYEGNNNYSLVRVGYSPVSNIDQISAEVKLYTPNNVYRKRVGSSGEAYSQSLLNIVHFGLGNEGVIDSVIVTWRNGEKMKITDKKANFVIDTEKVDPTSLALNRTTADVRDGEAIILQVVVEPSNAYQDVVWESSDTSIIKVSQDGDIIANGSVGQKATITATSPANGLTSSCEVTIITWYEIFADTVIVTPDAIDVLETFTTQLSYKVEPYDVDDKSITWSSMNEDVATVDQNGLVTVKIPGTAEIRATSPNGKYGVCTITGKEIIPGTLAYINADNYISQSYSPQNRISVVCEFTATSAQVVDGNGVGFVIREVDELGNIVMSKSYFSNAGGLMEKGTANGSISARSLTPSNELNEGHYYELWAYYTEHPSGNIVESSNTVSPITIVTTDIDDNKSNLIIYPNPAKNTITIETNSNLPHTFKIFNTLGNECLSSTINNSESINIEQLSKGIYFVKVFNSTESKTIQLVIE